MSQTWRIVVRQGALGDFILSLPLLRALARQNAPVCLITRRAYLPLLPPGCRCERWLDCDSASVASILAGDAPPDQLAECFQGAEAYLFLARDSQLEAVLRRYGVRNVTWLNPRPTAPPHVAVRFLREAGLPVPADLLEQPLWPAPDPASASTPGRRCLWVHPGSGSARKNWPAAFFAKFAAAWQQDHGEEVLVSFGEADEVVRPTMLQALAALGVRYQFRTGMSLAELKDRLSGEAALFVGNDSGVSHLAAALGVPSLVFFRATDPAVWRPLGHCLALLPQDILALTPSCREMASCHLPLSTPSAR